MRSLLIDPVEHRIRTAVAAVGAGQPVIVADDVHDTGEGALVFAAALATPQLLAFTVRHTSGFVCVALPADECDRLDLPPMHGARNGDHAGRAFRVSVDLLGTGTGISATARARTIAALAAPTSGPRDFVRPGHVVPVRTGEGGVLGRPAHAEAAVDLARLAGLPAVGGLATIVSREDPRGMARGPELAGFAAEHDLVQVSIGELVEFRKRAEPQVDRVAAWSCACGRPVRPHVTGVFRG